MATPSPSVELKSSPAAPEEAMDVKSTNFEDNVWYKKYQLLKRKCSEFEQVDSSVAKLKNSLVTVYVLHSITTHSPTFFFCSVYCS